MNIASDLRPASYPEANIPVKDSEMPDPVTAVPVSVTPVASVPLCSTDVDEVGISLTSHLFCFVPIVPAWVRALTTMVVIACFLS